MSTWLVWVVTAIYIGQAAVCAWERNTGFAVMFAGYAFANLGVIWSMK